MMPSMPISTGDTDHSTTTLQSPMKVCTGKVMPELLLLLICSLPHRHTHRHTDMTDNITYPHMPHMRVGNVFGHVCVSVSVCLSVQAITFEPLDIETSFLACRYILTISRSSLNIKVIGSRSRSYEKK